MNDAEDLTRALQQQADTLGDPVVTFADVRGRASRIRRRRAALTGAVAAALVAIAVPVGLSLGGNPTSTPLPPIATQSTDPTPTPGPSLSADPTPTTGPTPTAEPAPTVPRHQVVLTPQVEGHGGEPGIPYLFDGAVNLPDGSQVPLQGTYSVFVPLGDEYLAEGSDPSTGQRFIDRIAGDGTVVDTYRGAQGLVVSTDGTVVAWGTTKGRIMSLVAGGQPLQINGDNDLRPGATPIGVLGSGTCMEAASATGGCTVFYNAESGVYYSSSHGITDSLGPITRLNGVAPHGDVSGVVSVTDQGSCSIVMKGGSYKARWKTCDYTLGQFSPDGRYVLGIPAYLDGVGYGSAAVLDARTGEVLADFKPSDADARKTVFMNNTVWETDSTLLTTLWFQDGWYLMRLGADGALADVSKGALAGGNTFDEVPLHFQARP